MKFQRRLFYVSVATLLAACTTFDRTDIAPGMRIYGPGASFLPPGPGRWSTSLHGTGHKLHLNQLNANDSFSIRVSLNKGPDSGPYPTMQAFLRDFKTYQKKALLQFDLAIDQQSETISTDYPGCIEYSMRGRDWRGRNNPGPARVAHQGLSCIHPAFDNALLTIEIQHRAEPDAAPVELNAAARALFSSLRFEADYRDTGHLER